MSSDRASTFSSPAVWFVSFAVCQLLFVGFLYPGGHLTWDSGTYHLMAKTLLETGGFFIKNGLDLFHSPIMRVGQTVMPAGNLVSHYPELYTFLAVPFYAIFGFLGFSILNSCAFIGTCFLIWRLTPWFNVRRNAGVIAVLIYMLATYAWEYSVSSYPHITSTFLILFACYMAWSVYLARPEFSASQRSEAIRLFLAGLVFGIAIGARLDSLFAGLALFFPLLTGRGVNWRRCWWITLGLALPLAVMAWINMIKFGTPNPFTYGRPASFGFIGDLRFFLPAAITIFLFALVFAYRDRIPKFINRRMIFIVCGVAIAAASWFPLGLLLSSPSLQDANIAKNMFQILVDLRIRPDIAEPGLSRSDNGAMIYMGGVKKALFQSAPYLVLLLPSLIRGLWRGKNGNKTLLWLVPFGFIGVFGMLAWDGSVALNMRFFNPILPFLAILTAREWLVLGAGRLPEGRVIRYSVLAWLVLCAVFIAVKDKIEMQEMLFLNISLAIAAVLLVLQLFRIYGFGKLRTSGVMSYLLLGALIWSSALMFSSDFYKSTRLRLGLKVAAEHLLPQIENNALILTDSPDMIWPILDRPDKVLISTYNFGTCAEIKMLIAQFAGVRPIYWLGLLQPDLHPGSRACIPKKLTDGRQVRYERPERWNPRTDDWLHRVKIVDGS